MRTKSFLKVIKPKTFFWFTVSTCYGFASVILNKPPPPGFIFLVLTIVFANIGAIIVNDISDIEVDSKSVEPKKRNRPFVTKEFTVRQGIAMATTFFFLSIITSIFYNWTATIFSGIVIIMALIYSLPPFRFCARPYGSMVYWIILSGLCYYLMLISLQSSATTSLSLWQSKQGLVFIIAIIFFMGIAEVLAKDLRDLINDAEADRNTFVNFIGVVPATKILIFFAWLGYILWIDTLYISRVFPQTITAWLCVILGLIWCIQITIYSSSLANKFNQSIAAKMHTQWTYVYAIMQILTFFSFCLK